MIVTDEILTPYRSKNGRVRVTWRGVDKSLSYPTPLAVPENLFTLTSEEFGWSDNSPLPGSEIVLMLAFTMWVPVLNPNRQWLALVHQAGGLLCEHIYMIATLLEPRPEVASALRLIAQEGHYAESGRFSRFDLLASRIAAYVSNLTRIGVDCECTWRHLTESLYPIDATQINLNKVAKDAPDLKAIANWGEISRARYNPDPAIFFMTQNSD